MKKTIVVTGATSGVGEEVSKQFIEMDWNVIGLARNKEKLEEMEVLLGKNFKGLKTDIRVYDDVSWSFDYIRYAFGKIDVLVNNAAVFKRLDFVDCTLKDVNSMIDTNLKGTIYCSLEAAKLTLETNDFLRIINIASVAGLHGIEKQAIYCASKHGVRGFSDVLSQELKEKKILVTTIFPGGIDTPLWNDKNPYLGKNKDLILKPNDIVEAIKYIVSLRDNVIVKEISMFTANEWH